MIILMDYGEHNVLIAEAVAQKCFPLNFAKFLRTPFLLNTSGRLLQIDVALMSLCFHCIKYMREYGFSLSVFFLIRTES